MVVYFDKCVQQRLNMELDLRTIYLGSKFTAVQSTYSLSETPQPPLPPIGLIYEGAIGKPR